MAVSHADRERRIVCKRQEEASPALPFFPMYTVEGLERSLDLQPNSLKVLQC